MFSQNQFNELLNKAMSELGISGSEYKKDYDATSEKEKSNLLSSLTPSQLLVIAGLFGGVLNVDSVLVDKDQTVQIVLSGTLKQKTELEKTMDQIGQMPFDKVLKAMLGRL